jgi:hypothetical protein
MSRHPQLYPWAQEIATRLPALNRALATVLALWSVGMVLTKRSGLDSVTQQLTSLLGQSFNTVRQRLREFYQESSAKRGRNRTDFEVSQCFASLLRWVLSFWSEKRLALALDVTNLGERYHLLCVSALCAGVGIPVAWKILKGNQPDAWHPYWCELLAHLKSAVGDDWQVVVLSDRGLESARLFRAITAQGWHPLMRVKAGSKFRPQGWHRWYWLSRLAPRVGTRAAFTGQAYKGAPLPCTLLICWDQGHAEPWLLLTDLPPRRSQPVSVCLAGMDRAGLQSSQERWPELAEHAHDANPEGRTLVFGGGGDHPVAGGGWGGSGAATADRDAGLFARQAEHPRTPRSSAYAVVCPRPHRSDGRLAPQHHHAPWQTVPGAVARSYTYARPN